MTQPVKLLEGKKIYLRPFEPGDIEAVFQGVNAAENRRLTGTHRLFSRASIAAFMEKVAGDDSRVDLAIVTQADNETVGEVVLNETDFFNRSANIRIGIYNEKDYSQGYGSEAMRLMLGHAFGSMNLHRVELGVYEFNPRAIHVYEKLGFKREGVIRDALYHNHRYHDMITMSILEDEFRAKYPPEA